MKRRNFFKSMFGAYATLSGYFTFKYFEGKNNNKPIDYKFDNRCEGVKNDTNKKIIGLVGFPIVHHCNLNCAYCDHFAPIAPFYQLPVETFKKDMERLSKITKDGGGEIKVIWIIGGEPLLHDNLAEIFKIARTSFPKSKIEMTTNGFLLENQQDSFWESCSKYNIKIIVENYIYNKTNINFEKICNKLKEHHCDLRVNGPKYQFKPMDLTKEKMHNINERYQNCFAKLWPMFENGKFYSCSTINGMQFFNKKFPQHAINVAPDDFLDIYKINSFDEIIEFYEKPKSVCAHCNYFLSKGKRWRTSNQELSEWYKG